MNKETESGALSLMCQCIDLNYPKITPQDFAEIKEALLQAYVRVCVVNCKQPILIAISSLVCDVEKIKEKAFSDNE